MSFKKFLFVFLIFCPFAFLYADNTSSWAWGRNPEEVLDKVVQDANKKDGVQETALDEIDGSYGIYWDDRKITNTFDSIRENIAPYIDWAVFIGLSIATILIIYNWLMLVTLPVQSDATGKVMTRLKFIIIWVLIITGFYFIIKLVLSLVANIV